MNKAVSGVVLKAKPCGERDMVLTLLTAEEGRIHVLARGVGRNRKQSALYAQNFVYSQFQLFRGRGMYVVDAAEPEAAFYNLRQNLSRLALAQYFADVAERIGTGPEGGELLSLLLNSLYLLSDTELDETLLKVVYEVRVCQLEGSFPDLACGICGAPPRRWSFREGFFCESCPCQEATDLTPGMAAALAHICAGEGKRMWSFFLNRESLTYLSRLTGAYVEWVTDTRFDSLNYYNSLVEFSAAVGDKEDNAHD